MKQTGYKVFLQRRWVYVGCTEIYNLSSETMVAMWEFPQGKGKECFLGRAIGNKEPMAFLLAKSSPERVFLFPIGYVIVTGYDTQLYILRFLFISFFLHWSNINVLLIQQDISCLEKICEHILVSKGPCYPIENVFCILTLIIQLRWTTPFWYSYVYLNFDLPKLDYFQSNLLIYSMCL